MQTTADGLREQERLAALHSYHVLDSAAERSFDDLTRIAAEICRAPVALISLVDEDRQWFKSRVGIEATQTPRSVSFCDHAIRGEETMIVEDATADPRFVDNALVTGPPWLRFYAGAPLVDADGHVLGTVCVIDSYPRTIDAAQREALEALSRQVIKLLELRRCSRMLADCVERVAGIARPVPVCGHCHSVRNNLDEWQRIETVLRDLTGAELTHGVCPACLATHYADDLQQLQIGEPTPGTPQP